MRNMSERHDYYKEYYQNNKQKLKEKAARYYILNKDRIHKLQKEYNATHREQSNERSRRWRRRHKDQVNEIQRRDNTRVKLKLMNLLGGCQCRRCGFSDIRALQIDHINGKGKQLRIKLTGSNRMNRLVFYYYLRDPEMAKRELQVLCANCNWIKRHENREHT
jgi:hypothetical protein